MNINNWFYLITNIGTKIPCKRILGVFSLKKITKTKQKHLKNSNILNGYKRKKCLFKFS